MEMTDAPQDHDNLSQDLNSDAVSVNNSEFASGSVSSPESDPEDDTYEPDSASQHTYHIRPGREAGWPKRTSPRRRDKEAEMDGDGSRTNNVVKPYSNKRTKPITLDIASAQLTGEFCYAGHTTLVGPGLDQNHPLHSLYSDTYDVLENIFASPVEGRPKDCHKQEIDKLRQSVTRQVSNAEDVYRDGNSWENHLPKRDFRLLLPLKSRILALRFASASCEENAEIIDMLAHCDSLHLFQVNSPQPDKAASPENLDTAPPAATEFDLDAPGEAVSRQELLDLEDRIKAVEDTCRHNQESTIETNCERNAKIGAWADRVNSRLDTCNKQCDALPEKFQAAESEAQRLSELVEAMQNKMTLYDEALQRHGLIMNGHVAEPRESPRGDFSDDMELPRQIFFGGTTGRRHGRRGEGSFATPTKRNSGGAHTSVTPKRARTQVLSPEGSPFDAFS